MMFGKEDTQGVEEYFINYTFTFIINSKTYNAAK